MKNGFLADQEKDELHHGPHNKTETGEGHGANLRNAFFAECCVQSKSEGGPQAHDDTDRSVPLCKMPRRGSEEQTAQTDREHGKLVEGEVLVRNKMRKDHREHRIERDQDCDKIGIGMHDAHLKKGHADNDVDEGKLKNKTPVSERQFVAAFFEIMQGEGKKEQAANKESQKSQLKRRESVSTDFEGNFHRAECKRGQKNPDIFFKSNHLSQKRTQKTRKRPFYEAVKTLEIIYDF